jgi:hypothetical protein
MPNHPLLDHFFSLRRLAIQKLNMKNMGPVYAASILSSRVCTDAIVLGQHDPYFLVLYKDGLNFFVYIVKKHYQAALSALAV